MYIRKFHIFFIVFYILLFTSCGGGGGSSPQTNIDSNPTPQSASFIDAPVYGIDYSCSGSSTTGTTNENGTFDYDSSCGTLTFTIGGVTLYSKDSALIPSDKRLYITDLVGVERTDTNNSKVLALSRFIQSLDDNNNPYDGIKINPDVKISLANSTIDFLTNPSIADLNNTIVNLGRTLVSENDAKAHFTYTLNNDLSLEIEGPPPPAPILTITPTITNQNSVTVEVNGQPQTTIFVNGITTNTTIPVTSKIEITLPLSGADGEYDFNISLQDNAHQIGNPKLFTIHKDTIAPILSGASDINVSENTIVMVDINANDATVTPYQSLVYSLSGGIDKAQLEINSTTGVISYLASIDYENPTDHNKDNIYLVTVTVTDGINIVSKDLQINVINIAETTPTLTSFTGSIVENIANNSTVGVVTFTSGDSLITNFELNNSDGSTQNIFNITNGGTITINDNSTIDFDNGIKQYSLLAQAQNDKGVSNTIPVIINVTNVNDIVPTIANFTGTLNENTTAGITVGNLVVTTGDSAISSIILTDLNSSATSDTFIASTTGSITVKSGANLDYETKNVYYLKAVATNSSGVSTDANVTISLNDVQNEIVPIIKFFSGSVDENATVGTIIGTIDINSSGDSNITNFSLTGTGAGNFDINTTGTITLKTGASINYEITTLYQLEAYATNSAGDSAKVNVLLYIINISEIVPTLANTTLFVDENGTLGTSVGQVTITTLGDSNITSFSLTGTNASNFTISSTGMITVASGATLSYPNTFSLEAKATNQAGESNPITVTITVQETPTSLPVLHPLVVNVKEGTLKDTVIGQISIDAGNTAIREIVFTTGLNTHDDAFTITSDGKIRVSGDVVLDFETRPQYQFNVQAINALGESNIVTITINIVYVENLYILSAVYDNNNTTLDENSVPIVDDDTLYLYFNKTVDMNTFSADRSEDFNITNGTGAIGSGSTTTYSDTPYHLYTIKGNYATGSLAFTAGLTKISIANQALTDDNGSFPTNYIATTVEAFRYIVATGQTTSYDNNGTIDSEIKDDGYYHKGKSKSFIRDDTNNIVVDNTNGLIWEDTTNTTSTIGSWTSANNYCQGLIIGIYTNWRLPTIQEWLNIVDRTKYEPVIDTTYFQNNVNDKSYWSSTVDATDSTKVWRINIGYGSILTDSKVTDSRYVRCVHDK